MPGRLSAQTSRESRLRWSKRCQSPPDLPLVVVTDRDAWAEAALGSLDVLGLVAERAAWSSAPRLDGTPAAVALDVAAPFGRKVRQCERWAARAWQPLCVCCLAAEPGAARVAAGLRSLGYSTVELLPSEEGHWQDLLSRLRRRVENHAWIATRFAQAFGCYDRWIVEAFHVALDTLPAGGSMEHWAARLGLRRRQDLAVMFAERGLPRPKALWDWVRLIRLIEFARAAGLKSTREKLAREFGYSSGDYLGRRVRELSGVSLGALLEAGPARAIEIMAERLRGRRRPYIARVVSCLHGRAVR